MEIQVLELARKQDQMEFKQDQIELKQDEMKVVKFIAWFLPQYIFYYFIS